MRPFRNVQRGMKITKNSHLDHSLSPAHVELLLKHFGHIEHFAIQTIDIPLDLPELPCSLRGPACGDPTIHESEVVYEVRGDRAGKSRISVNHLPKPSRRLTAIMGMHEGECILFTAYGGPAAPREPWDPSLDEEGREESKAFWLSHALAR